MSEFFCDLMRLFLAGVYLVDVDSEATAVTVAAEDGGVLVLEATKYTTVWDEVGEKLFLPWFEQKMKEIGLRMLVDQHSGTETIHTDWQVRLFRSRELVHDTRSGHLSAPRAVAALYFIAHEREMENEFPEFTQD